MNKLNKYLLAAGAGTITTLVSVAAHAQNMDAMAKAEQNKYFAVGATIGLGLAALGGALGQGRAAAAALEGIARNPGASDKLFTPMILGLALIESLVIYALVIAFLMFGKL